MNNPQIASQLDLLADLLEFTGTNPFKLRAYRNAARVIRDATESLESMVASGRDLTTLPGIGKSVAEKCTTLVRTGRLPQLEKLLEEIPKSVLEMLRIPGLGPRKVAALFHQLKVRTLEELRAACEAGRVQELPGFGAKTEQAILAGLPLAVSVAKRPYWADADAIVDRLRAHLSGSPAVGRLEFAGSYRRGKETVGDLDILVTSDDPAAVMQRLAEFPGIESEIGRGDTKMSVRLADAFQVDLRVVPEKSFGAALQYFTGSKDHNVVLRGMAKDRGLKINEWGVFRVNGKKETWIGGETEEQVYAALDLPVFPPEMREARGEFRLAEEGPLPRLVTLDDIRGDLHMHTTATDGKASIGEMAAAAKAIGLKYIAITDHSKRVAMARGLDDQRLLQQWIEVDEANRAVRGITILKGIEVDILADGSLDISDEVLAQADWVTASVHYGGNQPTAKVTGRILSAIEHPHVHSISHPSGRLLNRREPHNVDMEAVISAAAEHGKLLELNANPARLDLNDVHCAMAREAGVLVVINTDAHSPRGLGTMRFGITQARRGGLTPGDVANTRTWPQLRKLLGKGR
jgi:DNA polymerase (family 10)